MLKHKIIYNIFIFSLLLLFLNINITFAVQKSNVSLSSNDISETIKQNPNDNKDESKKYPEFIVTGNNLKSKMDVFKVTGNETRKKTKYEKGAEFVVTGKQLQSKLTDSKSSNINISSNKKQNEVKPTKNLAKNESQKEIKDNITSIEEYQVISKKDKDKRYMTFCSGNFFYFYGYGQEDKDKMDLEEYFKSFKETSKTGKTFEITGDEIGKKKETEFIVTGNEINKKYKQNKQTKQSDKLTDYQKEKLEYIFMEEKGKLFGLRRMLNVAKKLLYSELSKENYNLTVISNLKQEILSTASDIELIKFETECKIRGLLSLEQYNKLKSKIQQRRSL